MSEHRVHVLRHAATEWSGIGRHTSHTDIPLTSTGEYLARLAGQTLATLVGPGATVLSSPLGRARRTAELAGFTQFASEPLLHEWDYGDYEGLTTEYIRETVPDWTVWTHPCPGGESTEDVAERAAMICSRARTALEHGDVVLVGHGHFGRALIAAWLDLPVTAGVRFALEPAGIAVLGHERGVGQLQQVLPTPVRR